MANADKNDEPKSFYNQVAVAVLTGLCGMSMMHAMNFATFGIPSLEKDPQFKITTEQGASIASTMPAFGIVGNLAAGILVEWLGRRSTMFVGALFYVVAWPLLATSSTISGVLMARALFGFGGSLLVVGSMLYMAESVHPAIRGRLGALTSVLVNCGMLLSFISGSLMEWRESAWVAVLGTIPIFVLLLLVPESPLHLLRNGRKQEALDALGWLRSSDSEARQEWEAMIESAGQNAGTVPSIRELFSTPMFVAINLLILQQATGIMGITTFSVAIFKDAGTPINPSTCTIMIALVNIVTASAGGEIHTRFDRKPTLVVATMFIVNLQVCIGVYFWAQSSEGFARDWAETNNLMPLICLIMYFIAFTIGPGPIPFMFLGEGLPARIRGIGSAIASTFNMIALFIGIQAFSLSMSTLGYHNTFFLCALLTTLSMICVYPNMPETRGKSIAEMDAYYVSDKLKKKQ